MKIMKKLTIAIMAAIGIAAITYATQPSSGRMVIEIRSLKNGQVERVIQFSNRGSSVNFTDGAIIVDTWLTEPEVHPFDLARQFVVIGVQ
jgi:hypothetical protein